MFVNYAHRGASEYAPENTFASFCMGIEMGANGIETDVRKTRDNVLVLFHDDAMVRLTGENIRVGELTYEELITKDIGSFKGEKYRNERVVSYEDFLKYFGGKNLHFAIELKDTNIEKEVVEKIYTLQMQDRAIVTSFHWESLTCIRSFDKTIRLGYLSRTFTKEGIDECADTGLYQICPQAAMATKELVDYAKGKGLNVRAWGVKNADLMLHCLNCGVDGMTVNFPDMLTKVLGESTAIAAK